MFCLSFPSQVCLLSLCIHQVIPFMPVVQLCVPQIDKYHLAFSPTYQIHINSWPMKYPRNTSNSMPFSIFTQCLRKSGLLLPVGLNLEVEKEPGPLCAWLPEPLWVLLWLVGWRRMGMTLTRGGQESYWGPRKPLRAWDLSDAEHIWGISETGSDPHTLVGIVSSNILICFLTWSPENQFSTSSQCILSKMKSDHITLG